MSRNAAQSSFEGGCDGARTICDASSSDRAIRAKASGTHRTCGAESMLPFAPLFLAAAASVDDGVAGCDEERGGSPLSCRCLAAAAAAAALRLWVGAGSREMPRSGLTP